MHPNQQLPHQIDHHFGLSNEHQRLEDGGLTAQSHSSDVYWPSTPPAAPPRHLELPPGPGYQPLQLNFPPHAATQYPALPADPRQPVPPLEYPLIPPVWPNPPPLLPPADSFANGYGPPAPDPNLPVPNQHQLSLRASHGPLQAERLERQDAATERKRKQELAATEKAKQKVEAKERKEREREEKEQQKEREKEDKRQEKEDKKREKEEERQAAQAAKQAEKEAKEEARAAKGADMAAAKAAKEVEKELAKGAKKAGKATKMEKAKATPKAARAGNKRAAGASDDEIEAASIDANQEHVDIKLIVLKEPTRDWRDDEAEQCVAYITSVWKQFKVKQQIVFEHVSKHVLNGSKTRSQVGNFWNRCWKKFKACQRRAKHTGGGDGDDLQRDEANEEKDLPDSGSEVDVALDDMKKEDRTGGSAFSEAQLDEFEQTELYNIILAVAGDNPEVLKMEEFDQARAFSDSETAGTASKTSISKSEANAEDRELLKQAIEIIGTSVAGFRESRQATTDLAERRDQREQDTDAERRVDLKEDRALRKRRLDFDEEAANFARQSNDRRLRLEERQTDMAEQEFRDKQWEKVERWLSHPSEVMRRRGERLAAQLEAEDKEMKIID